jgi:hypothetical protein
MRKPSRRTLLRSASLGAALAAGGGLPLLLPGRSRAGGEIPRRIVFFYVMTGSMVGRWEPVLRAGAAPDTETEWDVNPDLHGELAAYRNDLNYFENLDFLSEYDDPTDPANAHFQGGTHAMCAAHRSAANLCGGITIDQFIADHLNASGPVTPVRSLELRIAGGSGEGQTSARMAGPALPRIDDPAEAYDRLFPGGAGMPDPDAARIAMRRRRVFDLVAGRTDALAGRLGGAERSRIEQYRDSLSDLRARLDLMGMVRAEPPPRSVLDPLGGLDWSDPTAVYRTVSDIDIQLTAAALHTDTTRVVSLELCDAPDEECGYTPALAASFGTTGTHDLTHKVNDLSGADPLSRNPEAIEVLRRQHLASMRRVRALLDALAARIETDGRRLLDHTVVVFVSQIADGSHCLQGMPWFTVGGCGDRLRTGRFFRAPRRALEPTGWITRRWTGAGRGHGDLFVTLAQAMGSTATTFGAPSAGAAAIPGMLA